MSSNLPAFKKFVSEDEIAEAKKKRQEEWEKVRQPHQPEEAPEQVYDSRSLFERLQANKDKKQEEWDEAHRLKNMVKGLENDEVEFLETVSKQQIEQEEQKILEEKILLAEYKNSQVIDRTIEQEAGTSVSKRPTKAIAQNTKTQKQLLAGVVRRKSGESSAPKKQRLEDGTANEQVYESSGDSIQPNSSTSEAGKYSSGGAPVLNPHDTRTVIAILPGIGTYSDSSSDDGMDDDDDGKVNFKDSSSSSGLEEGIPFPTKPKVLVKRSKPEEHD